ncbi:CAP domain-containing protein [Natronosalvus caseinilyticus]|uniref:CAP domain-containing protein n=1 Tax=Natronosalvus caseinilyticus TaxID=2953747 RepID=UPI0028AD2BC9|nr:CAP domain-containing protein [Natronosalvus caseinilyticus]
MNPSPGTKVDGSLSKETAEPDLNHSQQSLFSRIIDETMNVVFFPVFLIIGVLMLILGLPVRIIKGVSRFIRMYSTPILALLLVAGVAGGFVYLNDETDHLEGLTNDLRDDQSFDEAEVERIFHEEINQVRTEHGADSLAYDDDLAIIASKHSKDMDTRDYFDHVDPNGQDVMDRYRDYGYQCGAGGENIAQTFVHERVRASYKGSTVRITDEEELAKHLVKEWMNSPGHRENILRTEWHQQGLGLHISDDGEVYATQNFC